jgi:hypothetical protein
VERPSPAEAIRQRHEDYKKRLSQRSDEISQLLSKASKTSMVGDNALIEGGGLTGAEHEHLGDLLRSEALSFREELREEVDKLRQLVSDTDPLGLLARFSALNMFGAWGEYFEPTAEGSEAKVEFLAGLLLTTPYSGRNSLDPRLVQDVFDGVDRVFDSAFLLNLCEGFEQGDELGEVRFASKGQWLSVRGASYEHHSRDLAHAIYDEAANEMRLRLGFNLSDVVEVEAAATGLMEERFNHLLREAGATAQSARTDASLLAQAQAVDSSITPDGLQQWVFLQVLESGFGAALTLQRSDLAAAAPNVQSDALTALLERLSCELGSIPEADYQSPLGPNPLTDRPFVSSADTYMLPVPGMVAREFPTLLERDMLRKFKRFSRRRAQVLDRLAVRYVAKMVEPDEAHEELFYDVQEDDKTKRVECDGLVVADRLAIVVEGKATPLSAQARSGDVARARGDLRRAIEDAALQGNRARRAILSEGETIFYDARGEEAVRLQSGSIDEVRVLNPTLHEMGAFSLHPRRLAALGLAGTHDFWSIYINDLRIISEVVQDPAEFLHYWSWRGRLPLGTRVLAVDEIDLFGSFLLRQQFLELEESPSSIVSVTGSSTDFDDYYMWETGHGPRVKRPAMFQVPAVKRFVRHLSRTKPEGWLSAAGVCLDLSLAELAFVDVELKRARSSGNGWVDWGAFDRCALLLLAPNVLWEDAWSSFRTQRQMKKRVLFAQLVDHRARLIWALDTAETP